MTMQSKTGLPLPPIRVDVFATDPEVIATLVTVSRDPAAARQKWTIVEAGVKGAVERYKIFPSPDLVILQSDLDREKLLAELETLGGSCSNFTKAFVIGRENDVGLFRSLQQKGVSDYLICPLDPTLLTDAIRATFGERTLVRNGRISAFLGVSGGCGSSTIAQNVAVARSGLGSSSVMLVDMDLQSGTLQLNFDEYENAGMNEIIQQADRVDATLIERISTERSANLRILTCAPDLGLSPDLPANVLDHLFGLAMHSGYHLFIDLPRCWSGQVDDVLRLADDVVLTTTNDLKGLRNFKITLDRLASILPQQSPILVCLNQTGVPGRIEVPINEFRKAAGSDRITVVPFDARTFSQATAKGRTVVETKRMGVHHKAFHSLARQLIAINDVRRPEPIWSRFVGGLKRWW